MPQLHSWQPLSVCRQNRPLGVDRKILSIRKEPMLSGFSHSKWLSWLSGKALAAQARGVLGSTPGGCPGLFHFPL